LRHGVDSRTNGEQHDGPVANVDWVTDDLVAQTIEAWQPLSKERLTAERARSILLAVSQLFDAVGLTSPQEAVADA
jgi:hypothetical protein